MTETITPLLVPIIAGAFTLIGVIITVRENGRRQTENLMSGVKDELKSQHEEFKVEQAVMTEQIKALRIEVEKHNNFAQRMPALEERVNLFDRRIQNLEDDNK